MGERMVTRRGAQTAPVGAEQLWMGIAWRAVTVVTAAAVAVAVAAGLAEVMPDGSSLPVAVMRAVALVSAAPMMAIGTFRTVRYALVLGGVPADHPFVPEQAPEMVAQLSARLLDSRRALGATVVVIGLLLGFLGARMSGGGDAQDEFAELPRRGFENSASGGFAVDVPGSGASDWWDGSAPGGPDFGRSDSGSDRDGNGSGGQDGGSSEDDADDGTLRDRNPSTTTTTGGGCLDDCTNGEDPGTDLDDDVCESVDYVEGELGSTTGDLGGTLDDTTDDGCELLDDTTDEACDTLGNTVCETVDDTVDTVDDTLDDTVEDGTDLLNGLLTTTSSSSTTTSTSLLGGLLGG